MKFGSIALSIAAVAALGLSAAAQASTVAYWRFENGTAGADVPHTGADGAFDPTTPDVSGNGNDLSAFTQGSYAGFRYTAITPNAAVPQTGLANTLAIQNTGGYPAAFTSPTGTQVVGGIDARTITPLAWTIEASYKPENTNWWRTVVGRDAYQQANADPNVSALYFQITPDNRFRASYVDVTGVSHEAFTNAQVITNGYSFGSDPTGTSGQFYNLAATMDGTMLRVYVDGVLMGSTDLTGSSADLRLSNGSTGISNPGGDAAGVWTVGRGLWQNGHTDRAYGLIDEVRISDTALAPGAFLAVAVPEPATVMLLAAAGVGMLARRRRKA
jgi:hypothetical protein